MKQSDDQVKTPVKKAAGNKTTELIIGTAASRMGTAIKTLLTVVPEIEKLDQTILNSTLKVTALEDQIGGLELDLKNKTAQNKIELQQSYDTDRKTFIDKWLKENDFELIVPKDLQDLKTNLAIATDKVDETVQKAVHAATNSLKQQHINDMKIKDLELEKKEAANTAELAQLKSQNKFLEEQVTHWKNMLTSQMDNETKRAQYGAIGTINVGEAGKR